MPEYFTRYGQSSNPFKRRVLDVQHTDALHAQATANGLLLDIDGFTALSELKAYLTDRVSACQPAFVLIEGPRESGLSSAASAVLLNYREIRGLAAGHYVPVVVEAKDHDEVRLYKTWVAALYAKVQPKISLLKEVKQRLHDARSFSDPDTLGFDLQGVIEELRPALEADAAPVRAIASMFETIKTSKPIDVAQVVFEKSATICVFTSHTASFDVDKFIEKNSAVHPIRLGHLKAEEVQRVVKTRWGEASAVPFDAPTFSGFCEKQKHPVGVVLSVAEDLLKKRARDYESLSGTGQWPTEVKLGFTDVETLGLLEVVINGGTPARVP